MPSPRTRAAVAALAVSAAVSCVALSGCSISRDDEPAAEPSTSVTSPTTPTPTPELTPTPTSTPPQSPTPQPTATVTSQPTASTPEAALLSAAELPQLNATSRWVERRTGPAGQQAFGLCQKFDLLTIGAVSVVERTYTSGSNTAGQQVAEFPDAQNTVRASKVIEAWQRDCGTRVKQTNLKVRPISDVATPRGKGWWYLASYQRQGAGHFQAFGLVISGARMSLIKMDQAGQDHNYASGQDPVELAVKAVSARLG